MEMTEEVREKGVEREKTSGVKCCGCVFFSFSPESRGLGETFLEMKRPEHC